MPALPDTLSLPPTVLTRAGAIRDLPTLCAPFGRRGLLVHGASLAARGTLDVIREAAHAAGTTLSAWQHPGGEPRLRHVEALIAAIRDASPDWVAAVGGGSVIDAAKAAAGLRQAPQPVAFYHAGNPLPPATTPFIAAPTTAGTGSEATIVSVLTDEDAGVKKSIRHPTHMPRVVILDPELLLGAPADVVACSGMDALTQGIEAYLSRGATRLTDALAFEAIRLVYAALPRFYRDQQVETACKLLEGSFLAGLALSHARLGLVHGLAHPLGHRYHVAHGRVCAVCLPYVLRFNRETIAEKYGRLSACLDGDLLDAIEALNARFGIASPFRGQAIIDADGIMAETLASGSTKANPRAVTAADVRDLLGVLFTA